MIPSLRNTGARGRGAHAVLLGILAVMLASCIDVEDFAATWSKTFLDPDLAGHWRKISQVPEDARHQWFFNERHGAYEVQLFTDNRADDDGPMYPVKSLAVGPYLFLANGPQKGLMIRYKVVDGDVLWYKLDFRKTWAIIQEKYPDQKNIYQDSAADGAVKIKTFDDEVFRIISTIPDDDVFWHLDTALRRIK